MLVTKPMYYDRFACLAGVCPDTCCASWQVVIDPESLAFYQSLGGELGAQVREAIEEIEGEPCFRLRDGKCALLTPEGLCPIQRDCGHERLCAICRSFPRFSTEIGARRELGLSLSCPEAARLILGSDAPLTLCTEQTAEPMTDRHELSPELVLALGALRGDCLAVAQDRATPFSQRCIRVLRLCAAAAEPARKRRDRAILPAIEAAKLQADAPAQAAGCDGTAHFYRALRRALEALETLQPDFRARLLRALDAPTEGSWPEPVTLWEQLLCYSLYKYLPRAAFDRAIWPAAVFCLCLPLLLRQLLCAGDGQDPLPLCWRLSRELEHSEENMAALLRAFSRRAFRPAALTSILAAIPG